MEHLDLVQDPETENVGIFIGPHTAAALAVLLHVVDDNPKFRLSPYLVPLMDLMDKTLVGYDELVG